MNSKKLSVALTVLTLVGASTGAQAAAVINSFSSLPLIGSVVNFNDQDGLIINAGGDTSYTSGGLTFTADNQFTVGQFAYDLGENGSWGAGKKFLSFDNLGNMTLDIS